MKTGVVGENHFQCHSNISHACYTS